jgi:hypothetical protein
MRQQKGFQISLLFIRAEQIDGEEDDDEISEKWRVGFNW